MAKRILGAALQALLVLSVLSTYQFTLVLAQTSSPVATISPTTHPLLFGSSGKVEINIPKPGIAVRIEIPREFLEPGGVPIPENDTSFVTSNIRNDYFYYSVVDESKHWIYNWHDNASDGPCFKPGFSYYDPNAPYCLEIWNYLNSPLLKPAPLNVTLVPIRPPVWNHPKSMLVNAPIINATGQSYLPFDYTYLVGVDYCQSPNVDKFVFRCFSAPKFVLLHDLSSPALAGVYNFTISVTNRTNIFGYPDFVHAWNTTFSVPVSMAYNAGSIAGSICDAGSGPPFCNNPIRGKGIVYAVQCTSGGSCNLATDPVVARAYVNQSLCQLGTCGRFKLTGLAPGTYFVEGSAGVDRGVAYSLTPLGYPNPTTVTVSANSQTVIRLPLRRSPLVCGSINYLSNTLNPIGSLNDSYLITAGFNPTINLNITVEGTDALGHVFRFRGIASGNSADLFNLTTGVGVNYVGVDPYGTEFAGLPAPEDFGASGYTLNVNVWVSGYVQLYAASVTLLQSPGTLTPTCSPPNQPTISVNMRMGGLITGTLQFCNTLQGCTPESPHAAEVSLGIRPATNALFGGNILIEAFDANGLLRGVTVINGTFPNGMTRYAHRTRLTFYIMGFSEYYNHTLSGIWAAHDSGLPDGSYSLSIYVRGYELTSVGSVSVINGNNPTVTAHMTRGGAFQITVASYDDRFGTASGRAIAGQSPGQSSGQYGAIQAAIPFLFSPSNGSIPVAARVCFDPDCNMYVDFVINGTADTSSFQVNFAGQNWGLRYIWFYGLIPTHITGATYTLKAYTLGYVDQIPGGISVPNNLVGFSQVLIALFAANEIDLTVPLFNTPQSFTNLPEYDHAIGQTFSNGLSGAETANLTAGVSSLSFTVFGFGGMDLGNTTLCQTNVYLRGLIPLCGQGHFYYVGPDGTRHFDYGLDVGTYTAQVPEFGFTIHFLQVLTPPVIQFTDLLLQIGVVLQAIQMARVTQGATGVVAGYTDVPIDVAPLTWAQVQAINSTYSRSTPTLDGNYTGVDALFVPGGVYNVTFSDVQYQSQTTTVTLQWGGSYALTPAKPLCPIGFTC